AMRTELSEIPEDDRMVYAYVDDEAVASIISDWTGIPVGRMVQDEMQTILTLTDSLNKRVIGQAHDYYFWRSRRSSCAGRQGVDH
ncbi:MAG: hypothetical protein RLO12_12085, partial [Fulvivirga sp.]